jgi:hypothetical protein
VLVGDAKGEEKSEVAVWLAGDAGTGSVLLSFSRFGAFRMYVRTTNGVRNTSLFSNRRSKFTSHCMIQMERCLSTSNNIDTHFLD